MLGMFLGSSLCEGSAQNKYEYLNKKYSNKKFSPCKHKAQLVRSKPCGRFPMGPDQLSMKKLNKYQFRRSDYQYSQITRFRIGRK